MLALRWTIRRCVTPLLLVFLSIPHAPAQAANTAPDAEALFLRVRELGDSIRTREARGLDAAEARAAYPAALSALREALPGAGGAPGGEMRAALARGELAEPAAALPEASVPIDCETSLPAGATLAQLRTRSYACYSRAATAIRVGHRVTDRLSLLRDIAGTADPARRRSLYLAMEPMLSRIGL